LLNICAVGYVEQTQILVQSAESPVPLCSACGVDTAAAENMKSHESPGINQIPPGLINRGSMTVCCGIQKIKCSVWEDQEVLWQWKEPFIVPVYKKVAVTDCSRSYQLRTEFYRYTSLKVNSMCS
jgi:hypothetical protein